VPGQPLHWEANVLFRHPPHVPSAERAAPGAARDGLGEQRSPRAARSSFLSPLRAERGEGKMQDYHPHLPLPVGAERGEGKVQDYHPPFLSPWERKGVRGRCRTTILTFLSPWEQKGVRGRCGATILTFLSPWEQKGVRGRCRTTIPPSSPRGSGKG